MTNFETIKEEEKKSLWEKHAHYVENLYGAYVDWEERFYDCPFCSEPVYECDWDIGDLDNFICPICEDNDEEEE